MTVLPTTSDHGQERHVCGDVSVWGVCPNRLDSHLCVVPVRQCLWLATLSGNLIWLWFCGVQYVFALGSTDVWNVWANAANKIQLKVVWLWQLHAGRDKLSKIFGSRVLRHPTIEFSFTVLLLEKHLVALPLSMQLTTYDHHVWVSQCKQAVYLLDVFVIYKHQVCVWFMWAHLRSWPLCLFPALE